MGGHGSSHGHSHGIGHVTWSAFGVKELSLWHGHGHGHGDGHGRDSSIKF